MNKSRRMQLKLTGIVIGSLFLVCLAVQAVLIQKKTQPEGLYITGQEVENLLLVLESSADGEEISRLSVQEAANQDGAPQFLTYGTFRRIRELFPEIESGNLSDRYKNNFYVLSEDWYAWYDLLRAAYDTDSRLTDITITVLGTGGLVTDTNGVPLEADQLVTLDTVYGYRTERIKEYLYSPLTAVVCDGEVLAVRDVHESAYTLKNVWIMDVLESGILFFWNNYEIMLPYQEEADRISYGGKESVECREQAADLVFEKNRLQTVHAKTDKITGKLLGISEDGMEIEGAGIFPVSDEMKLYKIYGKLERIFTKDLRIGYDFTDFVLEDGKIQACLMVKDEAMEYIRVLVKTSDYGGAFHDTVTFRSDTDCEIRYGNASSPVTELIPAGTEVSVGADSPYFLEDRIIVVPGALTGKISLLNVNRSQGVPHYRGVLEIRKMDGGLAVVNELLLEEYLYAVVPSEMPSSYPLEALKTQALTARTYAFSKMLHAGLPQYGAHVDDSAGFQVYNNITEQTETTRAVKETKGEVLYAGEELTGAYYYSTSCGYGTDAGVWHGAGSDSLDYLTAKRIGVSQEEWLVEAYHQLSETGGLDLAAEDRPDPADPDIAGGLALMDNAVFDQYIRSTAEIDFERGESWYRWTYQPAQLDPEKLLQNLQARFQKSPAKILTQTEDGSFVSEPPEDTGRIMDMNVIKRNMGGVADELLIQFENRTVKVVSEHEIRYVLNDGITAIIRQDGSEVAPMSLLPSAFFSMITQKDGEFVTGFALTGGGFGHGVGMSQNGARSMAEKGYSSDQIATFFYSGSRIETVY